MFPHPNRQTVSGLRRDEPGATRLEAGRFRVPEWTRRGDKLFDSFGLLGREREVRTLAVRLNKLGILQFFQCIEIAAGDWWLQIPLDLQSRPNRLLPRLFVPRVVPRHRVLGLPNFWINCGRRAGLNSCRRMQPGTSWSWSTEAHIHGIAGHDFLPVLCHKKRDHVPMLWRFFEGTRKIEEARDALENPISHRARMLSHCSFWSGV